ncbi:methyltransferase [Fragilaria crotonensis]|nr:methyltransferase [Fragilaria crotonensis]
MTSDKRGFTFDFALDVGAIPVPAVGTNLLSIARDERGRSDFEFLKDISALMKEVSSQTLDSTIAVQLSDVQSLVKVLNPATSDEMIVDEIEREGTDIIPGRYEGGLKIWECSLDLCRYIWSQRDCMKVGYALEIGCGHGLPGCLLLRLGIQSGSPTKVLFADLNDFVLTGVTIPNVILNTKGFPLDHVANSVVLGAGDWLEMSRRLAQGNHEIPQLPSGGRFHLVLAAETTYTTESSEDTATLLAKHVAIDGMGLVATKRYYFGCGGGSDALRDSLSAQQVIIEGRSYILQASTVEVFDCGSGNIRELLKVVLQVVP